MCRRVSTRHGRLVISLAPVDGSGVRFGITVVLELGRRLPRPAAVVGFLVPELVFVVVP